MFDDAGFGISKVHLAGNNRTPPESILAALGFEPGQSIFGADIQLARQRLMKLDWVAEADVRPPLSRRHLRPHCREAALRAVAVACGTLYVVERDGGLITNQGVAEFAACRSCSEPALPAPRTSSMPWPSTVPSSPA
ncbi:MAG: FtsQ-type POTRA domain-containing protein [Rhizomicrobium sp.]